MFEPMEKKSFTTARVVQRICDLSQKQLNILGCTISYAHSSDKDSPLSLTAKNKLIDNEWRSSDFLHYMDMLEERYDKYPNERVLICDIVVQFHLIITALKMTKFSAEFMANNNCPE